MTQMNMAPKMMRYPFPKVKANNSWRMIKKTEPISGPRSVPDPPIDAATRGSNVHWGLKREDGIMEI